MRSVPTVQHLQTDLERDTCLAFTTTVVFPISRDSYCIRNRHHRLSGECHRQGIRLSGTRLHEQIYIITGVFSGTKKCGPLVVLESPYFLWAAKQTCVHQAMIQISTDTSRGNRRNESHNLFVHARIRSVRRLRWRALTMSSKLQLERAY